MPSEYVVDTHALIWFLTGNPRLGRQAHIVLSSATNVLHLPIVALAEACWIVDRGRTAIATVSDLVRAVDADRRISVVPLDRAILDASLGLAAVTEMHDRQIVATALHLTRDGVVPPLLTCDANIASSGVVPVIW